MENIYNLSGKAGNKLYTQCIHKYIKTKNKTKQKLCGRKGLGGNMPSYLRSLGGGRQGYFIFVMTFFIFIVSRFSIANRHRLFLL